MNIEKRIFEILSEGDADGFTVCSLMYAEELRKYPQKENNMKRAEKFTEAVLRKLNDLACAGKIEWRMARYGLK